MKIILKKNSSVSRTVPVKHFVSVKNQIKLPSVFKKIYIKIVA